VELEGAVAVVTGASSGFGELTAKRLAKRGATVVLAARRVERLEAVADQIGSRGGRSLVVGCDVTSLADLQELRDRVDEAFGRCDVLVNNAGVAGGGSLESLSPSTIERVVRVNVLGVMLCTRVFLPMMLERSRGHIVNVASLAGRFATPGASVYGATKHAVVAFSEALYYELRPRGIRVTSVNPGFARTEGFPQTHVPRLLVMRADRVARAIVRAIENDRAPEVNVPRGLGPLEAFRVLTPPLYRWGVRTVSRRLPGTRA
jgi:short-subunit dehydrogenase